MNRNEQGFIDLNEFDLKSYDDTFVYTFNYNNEKYYFKPRELDKVYYELIAEELAHDYGIECIDYDIAKYNSEYGVISKDFIKDNEYISMEKILNNIYLETLRTNNLNDIWYALEVYKINNRNITQDEIANIMNKITNIFMFDILIANRDRHSKNYGLLINNNKIDVTPIFDNEQLLHNYTLFNDVYLLGVDKEKNQDYPMINYFFDISSNEYLELFKDKLWIISKENIENAFKKIELKINSKINERIKQEIHERFNINRKKIYEYLNEYKEIKK